MRLNINRSGKGTTRAGRSINRLLEVSAVRHHAIKAFVHQSHKLIITTFSPPLATAWPMRGVIRRIAPSGSALLRSGGAWVALEFFDLANDPNECHNLAEGRSARGLLGLLAERFPPVHSLTVTVGGAPQILWDVIGAAHRG